MAEVISWSNLEVNDKQFNANMISWKTQVIFIKARNFMFPQVL